MPAVLPTSVLSFPVSDATMLKRVTISATFPAIGRTELIYDGSIQSPYDTDSSATPVGTALNFVIRRDPVWPAPFTLEIRAVDVDGNETVVTQAYTLADYLPTVTQNVPDGEISISEELSFTIHDAPSLAHLFVQAVMAGVGRTETIFDGTLREPYEASSIVGDLYTFRREPIWYMGPLVISIQAIDADGNEATHTATYAVTSAAVSAPPVVVPVSTATTDQIYDALYQSVGDGQRGQEGSIVERWRYSRARGLEASTMDGKAVAQAFPNRATDFIPVYEDILGVVPEATWTEDERRDEITARLTRSIDAANPSLTQHLQSIDPRFQVVQVPYELSSTTEGGLRAFEDWDPDDALASGPAFDLYLDGELQSHTSFPNYSDNFRVNVFLDAGSGVLDPDVQRVIVAGQISLNEVLPAWVDFQIFTSAGFTLDEDLLDITVFSDGVAIP